MFELAIGHIALLMIVLYVPYRILRRFIGPIKLPMRHIKIGAAGLALAAVALWAFNPSSAEQHHHMNSIGEFDGTADR